MKYSANDNLEVLKHAKNYNNFLALHIIKLIKEYDFKKVLDFGCADGFFIDILKSKLNVDISGVEIDPDSIEVCKNKNIAVFDNIKNINSNSIDLIYMLNVLEHIEHDEELLIKLKEKLSKNGKILIYVPAFNELNTSMDIKAQHFRRYGKNELINKLKHSGFKVEKIEYCDSLGILAIFVYKILDYFKNMNGKINLNQVRFYDNIFFISRFLDKVFFSSLFGKNLLAIVSLD